ncbi:MAG: DUF58 domain-containing protein [Hyphomicrobiales bacterium]
MSRSTAPLAVVRTPGRPGPGPMPDALLRALDFSIARNVTGLLQGDYRASAIGAGTELAQVREYQPGDDVRLIDWNVTARTTEPHVRVHVAERVLTTWLLLDTSPSMSFGTGDRRKADVAEGVALATGHISTRRGNNLGVITFGDAKPRTIPPKQGRTGMLGLLSALRQEPAPATGTPTSLGEALTRVNRLARLSKLVIIVSDFRGPMDWRLPLVELCSRHTVIAAEIRDQREQELPDVGELWLIDPETGRQLRVDTSRRRIRERFAAAAAEERQRVAAELREAGAAHVVLPTTGDWLRTFAGFLNAKGGSR